MIFNTLKKYFLMILFFTLILFRGCPGYGQALHRPVAADYTSLGAYSTNNADAFSFTGNQASLAQLKNAAVGVYGERRFLLNELNNYVAVLVWPTSSGNFGMRIGYYGFNGYKETGLGLAYARKLGARVDIGAQFNYQGIRISGYGNSSAISFELGTVLHLTDKLHAGIHSSNPIGGKFGKNSQEKLPSVYSVGLGYDPSDKFFFSAEIEQEEDQPVTVLGGFQYQVLSQLFIRAGMSTATSTAWIGAGVILNLFRVDIAIGYHPQLGITPGLLLLFNLNSKKK